MRNLGLAFFLFILMFACRQNKSRLSADQQSLIEVFNLSYKASLEDRNPDSALLLARQIITLHHEIDDPDLCFDALTTAGLAHERMGNPDSSEFYYQKAVQFARQIDDPHKIAFTLQLEANNYIDRQKYRLARQKYADALILNKKIENQKQVAANYAGLGLAYANMQQPDSAIAYYLKAIEIFKSEKDSYNQAIVFGNIAGVFVKESMHPKAERYLKMAIKMNDSLQNYYSLGENYNTLGTVFTEAGLYDSSLYYLQKAMDLSMETGNYLNTLMAKFNMGKANTLAGNFATAKNLLSEVFEFCENNNIPEGQIRSLIQLGENERKQGNYAEAENYLKMALPLTKPEKYAWFKAEALLGLSKVAVDQKYADTQNYLVAYQELSDSISKGQLKSHIQELESFYQNKEKEEQIALLENDLQNRRNRNRLWIFTSVLLVISFIASLLYFIIHQKQLRLQKKLAEERSEKAQIQQLRAEAEAKLQSEVAGKNDVLRKIKEQEIIHQAQAYSRMINAMHDVRDELNTFKLKFRARKDTDAFDLILQHIDKANGLNPFTDLLSAFKDLHPGFYAILSEHHPELSPRELEMCALISLNMTSKQISVLLNITIKSVEVARHRIRRKMNLHPDQNLTTVIMHHLQSNS